MPINVKKRMKAIMKKRRKEKEAARKKSQPIFAVASPHSLIRRAREFSIVESWISSDWRKGELGLVQVSIARQQPDGRITFGVYLVDTYCLGLKNTFCDANFTRTEYRQEIIAVLDGSTLLERCPPDLAHQMVYQAIDYAAQFGFKPHKDFKLSQLVLEKRGTLPEPYTLTFGKDGKPLFIQGPHDNARAILARLEATAGPGNYDFLVLTGDTTPNFFEDSQ